MYANINNVRPIIILSVKILRAKSLVWGKLSLLSSSCGLLHFYTVGAGALGILGFSFHSSVFGKTPVPC